MRAAVLERPGLDNLKIEQLPTPEPGPGEVLVRLRAASINYRDTLTVVGGYGSRQKQESLIPLSDGAGEVVAVNDALEGAPATVNEDAQGKGWFLKLKPANPADLDELMTEQQYQDYLATIG